MSEIMQEEGLDRRNRIQVLKKLVYSPDPTVAIKALDQTWKLEGAYTEKRVNLNISYADVERNLEEMKREIRELDADLGLTGDDSKEEGQFVPPNTQMP